MRGDVVVAREMQTRRFEGQPAMVNGRMSPRQIRTYCKLETEAENLLKTAMTMGMVRLGEVGFDATRVKAANSRYATLTTPSIEKKLAAIDAQIDAIAETTATALEDAATTGFGARTELPEGLKSLEERRKKLAEVARTRDEERRQSGIVTQTGIRFERSPRSRL
jgi:hypothetical protein